MTLAAEVVAKLNEPLDPKRVKHREGSGGRSLSYLEGHDVIRTANDVFGIGNWSYRIEELVCLGEEPVIKTYSGQTREGFRVAYRATVCVYGDESSSGSVGFSDVGFGDAMEYTGSKLTPHELASKEAVTDGLKRALKNFGDQFGLCLYDKDAPEHTATEFRGTAKPVGGQKGAGAASSPAPTNTVQAKDGEFAGPVIEHEIGNGYGLAGEIDAAPGGKNYAGKQVRDLTDGQLKWLAGLFAPEGRDPWTPKTPAQYLLRRAVEAYRENKDATILLAEPEQDEPRSGYTDPEEIPF